MKRGIAVSSASSPFHLIFPPSSPTTAFVMYVTPYWFNLYLCVFAVFLVGCTSMSNSLPDHSQLVDEQATRETQRLYENLKDLSENYVLFGHQDDLAYGVHWKAEKGRSDVKETVGAYPAVYGWELGDLELGAEENLDDVQFDNMQGWIMEGYKRGGVITIGWHMNNPVSGGNAWDTTRAIHTILPGGEHHDMYKTWLDRFAQFVGGLKTGPFRWLGLGKPIPILFRPFHEHTGSWFWWGKAQISPEEYVDLWRFTVTYLRDEKGLHNLIYVYSTDIFDSPDQYLAHYPGDDFVDVLGYDDYHSLSSDEGVSSMTKRLRMLVEMAESRGKLPALTETGSETIPMPTWWTDRLLNAIKADSVSQRIAYALVWRNANNRPNHYYAPYPGHPSAPDFMAFYQDPIVLFEDKLPNLYR